MELSLVDLIDVKKHMCPIINDFSKNPVEVAPYDYTIKSGNVKIEANLEFIQNSVTKEYEACINITGVPDKYVSRTGILDILISISCMVDCLIVGADVTIQNIEELENIEFENLSHDIVNIWNKP